MPHTFLADRCDKILKQRHRVINGPEDNDARRAATLF